MNILNSYLGYTVLICIIIAYKYMKWLKPSLLRQVIKVGLVLLTSWILFIQCLLIPDMFSKIPTTVEIDYLIVLGAGLKGDKVSHTLAYRLDTAASYLELNPESKVIVSGGQGPDEWISEGLAMQRYLLSKGINTERILIENKSTSTEENIKFSLDLIDNDQSIGIITSNYHMYRAKYIAKPYIINPEGIAAPAPYWSLINYMIREVFTVTNEWRKEVLS